MPQKRHGERADAGPYLQNRVIGRDLGQRDDLLQDGIVHEEVLAERVLRGQPMGLQHGARGGSACERR